MMALELSTEVWDHAPDDLDAGELAVLLAVAEWARVPSRETRRSAGDLAARTRLSPRGLRSVMARLAERGLDPRVPVGYIAEGKRAGEPVYTHRGSVLTYRLPVLAPEGGATAPPSDGEKVAPQRRTPGATAPPSDPEKAAPRRRVGGATAPPPAEKVAPQRRTPGATAPPLPSVTTQAVTTPVGPARGGAPAREAPTRAGALFPAPPQRPGRDGLPDDVCAVVDAWERGAESRASRKELRQIVGSARERLDAGDPLDDVIAGAQLAGAEGGFADITVGVRKVRAAARRPAPRRRLNPAEERMLRTQALKDDPDPRVVAALAEHDGTAAPPAARVIEPGKPRGGRVVEADVVELRPAVGGGG